MKFCHDTDISNDQILLMMQKLMISSESDPDLSNDISYDADPFGLCFEIIQCSR